MRAMAPVLVFVLLCSPGLALAQQGEEVGVLENYSPLELTLGGVGVAGAIMFIGWGSDIFGNPRPGMGPPDTESVDWRFSHWANPTPDPRTKWLGGVPDLAGYVAPALTVGLYAAGTIGSALGDDFVLGDQKHELIAFTEAFAWSMVTVNALKLLVGRTRPFAVRPDIDPALIEEDEDEQFISFPSGHSASAAATTVFLALDLGDHLATNVLKDAHPAVQFSVGRVLPLVAAGGLTWTVMYGRIRDQRHWLSDTLTGAMIGAGFSTLVYTMHFGPGGQPRRNIARPEPGSASLMPVVGPAGAELRYGFTW